MTNGRYVDIENEVLRERLRSLKKAAKELIALIEMGGEPLNEAIDNLKEEMKW